LFELLVCNKNREQNYTFCLKKTSFFRYFFTKDITDLIAATTGSFTGNQQTYQQQKKDHRQNFIFHRKNH